MEDNKKQTKIGQETRTIHTYESDMADAVRVNEASVIKIALAEKEKREREAIYKKAEGTGFSKFLLTLGGILLIVAAGVGIYFLTNKNTKIGQPQSSNQVINTPISYDDQSYVDVSKAQNTSDLVGAINTEIQKLGKPESIRFVQLVKSVDGKSQLLTLNDFLSLIKTSAPSTLIRSLGDQYMIGTYTQAKTLPQETNVKQSAHLFIILPIKNYDQAYASMLTWEQTMLTDLFMIFHVDVAGDRSALLTKPWEDITINNRDARILYDAEGNDVLYYIFADKGDLVITDNQEAIKEISNRLITRNAEQL